jgi:hypothetical protein
MKHRMRRPSPSMAVALLALFVALSGTAIAAKGLVSGDKLIARESLSGNRLRKHTIRGAQVDLAALGKVPAAANADSATSATNAVNATNASHATSAINATNAVSATNATNADNATNAANATTATNATNAATATNALNLGGSPASSFVSGCLPGSVAAVGVFYAPELPKETFVLPDRYGGEAGFKCNGGNLEMEKLGTGFYRMRVSTPLPEGHDYILFINPDARGTTPLYGDGNSQIANVWDIHVFEKAGNPAEAYYIEVMLVAVA